MTLNLPTEWQEVTSDEAHAFEIELARELCSNHILAGVSVKCIARRQGRDDFLFRVHLDESEYAVAHLTWSKENSPDWPWTTLFNDRNDFEDNWRRILD